MTVPLSHMVVQAPVAGQLTSAPGADSSPPDHDREAGTDTSEFAFAMQSLYAEVDAAIASHLPVCTNRGQCCKFDTFGHRLYVTSVEFDYFAEGMKDRWITPTSESCPYQSGGRCNARDHRPLGCRVFFCEERSQAWQGPEYERFLARLKDIGERFEIPYRYREWLAALGDTGRSE